jgi:hypothetical protein
MWCLTQNAEMRQCQSVVAVAHCHAKETQIVDESEYFLSGSSQAEEKKLKCPPSAIN